MTAGAWTALVAAACLGVIGCSGEPDTGPPAVYYGQDVCAACTMIVSEEKFASAVVARKDGHAEPRVFDDLGCLFAWEHSHGEEPVVTRWVHDHAGGAWIPAEQAWYVRSSGIRSPMGSGVASFAAREDARATAESRGGDLLDWEGLRELARGTGLLAAPPRAADR